MDSSSSTARGGFLSSPRAQRRLMWMSGGVLGIGVIVFLSVVVFSGSSGLHSPISTVQAQHVKEPVKAPPDPQAYRVARQFIETAVLRKNLDAAYSLVGSDIRGGLTKKQWETGNIPVVGYPAGNAKTAGFTVVSSYKTQMKLVVDLVAKKGSGGNIRPHLPFWVGLVRAGGKAKGRWLVNYWLPDYTPPVQCGPNC
jgi:hypothetical protein